MARPKMIDSERRKERVHMRLTDEELKLIDYVAYELKLTRTGAILDAIQARADEIAEFNRKRKQV